MSLLARKIIEDHIIEINHWSVDTVRLRRLFGLVISL